ncbi:MAG TPA: hypothetical protein VF884_05420 [Nitrososphaeraceae archaeon]
MAFGQPSQTAETQDTKLCVDYKGTNLIIVRIRNPVDRELGDYQKELERQIASFHPTGIAMSSSESELNPRMGRPVTRYDIVNLIK